jgi:hypothetical protein
MNAPALHLIDNWMGRNVTHSEALTPEIVLNATHLIRRVNTLIALMHGIEIERHPVTDTPVSSGWRPPSVNASTPGAAPRSRHMTGQAIDLCDPEGEVDEWCLDHLDLLSEVGLWLESPAHTKGWCHLQSVPPRSGKRVFIP